MCKSAFLVVAMFSVGAVAQSDIEAMAKPPKDNEDTAAVLQRARALYDALEYDRVIPLVKAVLGRRELSADQRLDSYLLQGSALAIVGDQVDAEIPFRLLVQARPDYEMPADTPPKIAAIFLKVHGEEMRVIEMKAARERADLIGRMKFYGEDPSELVGGSPAVFRYRFDDFGYAKGVRVRYRKQGDSAYSALALQRDDEGVWRGHLARDWTANDEGFVLEYYVESHDDAHSYKTKGSSVEPLTAQISPGVVDDSPPPPLPLWSFVTATGTSVALIGAAAGFAVGTELVAADYQAFAASSIGGAPIEGAELNRRADVGRNLALATNVFWVAAGATVVVTAVMMPFTNWSGEKSYEELVAGE